MSIAGRSVYELEIKTREIVGSGTKDPIFIKILGTHGETTNKILTEDGF